MADVDSIDDSLLTSPDLFLLAVEAALLFLLNMLLTVWPVVGLPAVFDLVGVVRAALVEPLGLPSFFLPGMPVVLRVASGTGVAPLLLVFEESSGLAGAVSPGGWVVELPMPAWGGGELMMGPLGGRGGGDRPTLERRTGSRRRSWLAPPIVVKGEGEVTDHDDSH